MERSFKIGLVGIEGVGKTSIVLRLVDDYFSRSFKPSNGVFRIDYHLEVNEVKVTLCVNDFPGSIDVACQMKDLMKSLDAILIISNNDYKDISVSGAIKHLVDDIHQLYAFKSGAILSVSFLGPYIALVSNLFPSEEESTASNAQQAGQSILTSSPQKHVDDATLPSELTLEEEATKELAANLQIDFYRVSAYTGAGIFAMFEAVTRILMNNQVVEFEKEDNSSVEEERMYRCFCIPYRRRL